MLFFIIPAILDYKGTKEIILSKEIYSMKVWYIPFAIGFGYFVLKIYMSIIGRGLSLKLAGYRSYAQTIRDMFLHQLLYVNFPEEFPFRIYVSKYYTSLGVINVSIISSLFFGLAHILLAAKKHIIVENR